jgi:hypothetical protein
VFSTIYSMACTALSATVATGFNLGSGEGVFFQVNGTVWEFNSIVGDDGISTTTVANEILIDLDAANVGAAEEILVTPISGQAEFRTLAAVGGDGPNPGITVAQVSNRIQFGVNRYHEALATDTVPFVIPAGPGGTLIPGMTHTITVSGGYEFAFDVEVEMAAAGGTDLQVYLNGVPVAHTLRRPNNASAGTERQTCTIIYYASLAPGDVVDLRGENKSGMAVTAEGRTLISNRTL